MEITIIKGHKRLTADAGGWIFNGDTFAKNTFILQSVDESSWRDATDAEKEQWEREHQPEVEQINEM